MLVTFINRVLRVVPEREYPDGTSFLVRLKDQVKSSPIIISAFIHSFIWAFFSFLVWEGKQFWEETYRNEVSYPLTGASTFIAIVLICNLIREFASQEYISEQTFDSTINKILQTVRRDMMRTLMSYCETPQGKREIDASFGWVRTNIMLYNTNTDVLEIDNFAYRMEGDVDRWLALPRPRGIAWHVFTQQESGYFPVDRTIHPDYSVGQFHFTQQDWDCVNPDIQWIISVPLVITENNGTQTTTYGVLNIDSNIQISVLDIQNSELIRELVLIAQTYGKSVALILKSRNFRKYRGEVG